MILGVDPAIATTGWAVIDPSKRPIQVVDFGVATTEVVAGVDKTVSNARRIAEVGAVLAVQRDAYQCTTIAAEQALSFGTVHAVVPQALCWGVLAHLAEQRGVELLEVVSKEWQEAVSPGVSKLKKEKRYPVVEAEVSRLIGTRLMRIDKMLRTHVVDAVAVGVFAALRRSSCRTVIKRAGTPAYTAPEQIAQVEALEVETERKGWLPISNRSHAELLARQLQDRGVVQLFLRWLGERSIYASAQAVTEDDRVVEAKSSADSFAAAIELLLANVEELRT